MILNFIAASDGTPLVKNLTTGESYPNVVNVDSMQHDVPTLAYLHEAIKLHANNGHALLTGKLNKVLKNESRAGHSSKDPVDLLILDIDSNELPFASRDGLIIGLLGELVQYVFQHSASSDNDKSLRGHYFIQLSQPVSALTIKNYLRWVNFDKLKDQLSLSKSKAALKWPLDIVVNDPGRIIYIAPPIQKQDPISERIVFQTRGSASFTIPETVPVIDTQTEVNRLRGAEALPKRDAPKNNLIKVCATEVKITGIKESNDFVYLNLNNGDSWGYYFRSDNPDIVYNFKDEPNFRLKEVDPELHAKYKPSSPVPPGDNLMIVNGQVRTLKASVFIDPATDVYWQVRYDPTTNEVESAYSTGSRAKLNDFMLTNGEAKPGPIQRGTAEYNPSNLVQFDPANNYLNLFKTTSYLEIQETSTHMPQYVDRLIRHLTVDDECYNHFLNWLAFIYQRRERTNTSWLFHGWTGTGKGTLFSRILKPIFGTSASSITSQNLNDMFNGVLETSLIVFVDEFDINDMNTGSKSFNKLKNYITEEYIAIRKMRSEVIQVRNYCNFLFGSNGHVPIKIDNSERRINFPPRQNERLHDLPTFRGLLDSELVGLCKFLRGYKVDAAKAGRILMNDARTRMVINSRTSIEEFFQAIIDGDLSFFLDYVGLSSSVSNNVLLQAEYESTISRWVEEQKVGEVTVTREDVLCTYKYIIEPQKPVSMQKFNAICRNNGLDFETRYKSGYRTYAINVAFTIATEELPKSNVVNLR